MGKLNIRTMSINSMKNTEGKKAMYVENVSRGLAGIRLMIPGIR